MGILVSSEGCVRPRLEVSAMTENVVMLPEGYALCRAELVAAESSHSARPKIAAAGVLACRRSVEQRGAVTWITPEKSAASYSDCC